MTPLRKAYRAQIKNKVWPVLKSAGFTDFTDTAAWRWGERFIDCIQLETIPQAHSGFPNEVGEGLVASEVTFQVVVATYYRDVHLLPWVDPTPPKRPGTTRNKNCCHRWMYLAASTTPAKRMAGTTFWVSPDGRNLDAIVDDAASAIKSRGLAWLDWVHDIEGYLKGQDNPKPAEFEFTEEEQRGLDRWIEDRGLVDQVIFTYPSQREDLPEVVRRKWDEAPNHDMYADFGEPGGDVLYGLLVGSGRGEEAIEAMERDADPTEEIARYEQFIREFPQGKRTYTSELRHILKILDNLRARAQVLREHLDSSPSA